MTNYRSGRGKISKKMGDNIGKGKNAKERLDLLKKRKRKEMMCIAVVACIIMATVAYFLLFNNDGAASDANDISKTNLDQKNGFIYVDQSDISNGQLHFYEYKADNNKDVRYFLVEGSDGIVRGAFDLCIKLHPARSGWMIYEDYYIVCQDEWCAYPIVAIGTNQPACCKPFALPFEVLEDKIRIRTEDLEEASPYF